MNKSKKKLNTLIKRKNLIQMLKANGIKRTNKEALEFMENLIKENLINTLQFAKQNMEIHGRKTLMPEDIQASLIPKGKHDYFEI
ncbi:MAG: histone-like protein [Nanoarchaeota archaeon]